MNDCIFCKIIAGEIPSHKVYEDDKFLAFLDVNPINHGHTLVIPKQHTELMVTTPDDVVSEIFVLSKKIMKSIQNVVNAHLVSVKVVGDEVPHFHVHLIPLHKDNGYVPRPRKQYSEGEAAALSQQISQQL